MTRLCLWLKKTKESRRKGNCRWSSMPFFLKTTSLPTVPITWQCTRFIWRAYFWVRTHLLISNYSLNNFLCCYLRIMLSQLDRERYCIIKKVVNLQMKVTITLVRRKKKVLAVLDSFHPTHFLHIWFHVLWCHSYVQSWIPVVQGAFPGGTGF